MTLISMEDTSLVWTKTLHKYVGRHIISMQEHRGRQEKTVMRLILADLSLLTRPPPRLRGIEIPISCTIDNLSVDTYELFIS